MIPEKYGYVLRYGILASNLIFNECGPFSGGPVGWDDKAIAARKKKGDAYIAHRNTIDHYFIRIEDSILKEGFRNPILVDCGMCAHIIDSGKHPRLPLHMQEDHSQILTCSSNGGSRLWVAQKHNMEIPCVISDWVGRFSDFKQINSREELLEYYIDEPIRIRPRSFGLRLNLSIHQPHMED